MKSAMHLRWTVVIVTLCGTAAAQTLQGQVSNPVTGTNVASSGIQNGEDDYQRKMAAAMAEAKREYEEMLTNPPAEVMPLPNFEPRPGVPRPLGFNFYLINDHFPAYLLCEYDVSENHYDPSNEPEWFRSALLQIRALGSESFPPVEWIAVIIVNVAEHKGESTFQQSFKVGAIFKASDIFDLESSLRKAISEAAVDRHPFMYDEQQPTPGEQQRWTIVESHAATNRTSMPEK